MNDLAWLVGHRFLSIVRREYDWVIAFDKEVSFVIACLWRFVESGRIMLTSDDDGQSFGLSVPLDASAEVNGLLVNATIEAVDLRQKLLDIELRFSTGHLLQVIPVSSGYEAWTVSKGNLQYIAVGGGELAVSSNGSSND